jgi:hypothetical protein
MNIQQQNMNMEVLNTQLQVTGYLKLQQYSTTSAIKNPENKNIGAFKLKKQKF